MTLRLAVRDIALYLRMAWRVVGTPSTVDMTRVPYSVLPRAALYPASFIVSSARGMLTAPRRTRAPSATARRHTALCLHFSTRRAPR